MENVLLNEVEYAYRRTALGVWRSFGYPSGAFFHEFKSHGSILGLPLMHYTYGKCPETGRRVVAKGVFAVGRLALGIVAIGHASLGLIAIGQLAVGLGFGLGQLATGMVAVGQAALATSFALGQIALGYTAIGQLALGHYALGQIAWGECVVSVKQVDPQAVEYFKEWPILNAFFNGK